jgi:hypothetical protein
MAPNQLTVNSSPNIGGLAPKPVLTLIIQWHVACPSTGRKGVQVQGRVETGCSVAAQQ